MGYLACVLAGRIAAFAAVEAEFFQIPGGCRPARPPSILDVHAVTDPVAPYSGVPARDSPNFYALAVPAWLSAWALRDGCSSGPQTFMRAPEVVAQRWADCDYGAAVEGYRLADGGHTWPRALDNGSVRGARWLFRRRTRCERALRIGPPTPVPWPSFPRLAAWRSARRGEYRLPTPGAEPFDIARGPGDSIWFTEFNAAKIGRISPLGAVTEFRVPTPGAEPYQITAGPDGAMWFTEYNTDKIGRVSPAGDVSEIAMPRGSSGGLGIAAGTGGRVWVADPAGAIDRVTPPGRVSRTLLPARTGIPLAIARGTAGSAWITEFTGYFEHGRTLAHISASGLSRNLTLADPASNVDALAAQPCRHIVVH